MSATTTTMKPTELRHDFVMIFEVKDGNPNGDPDAGNSPRIDPETGRGLVSDVCLKRKVRDYVFKAREGQPRFDIYVKHRGILADEQKRAYAAIGAEPGRDPNKAAREWMCATFFDVRTFGAVMSTGKSEAASAPAAPAEADDEASKAKRSPKAKKPKGESVLYNCGQVRGPVQVTFARSIDPVLTLEHSITRVALTNRGDVERTDEAAAAAEQEGGEARSGQMGRKHTIPYGLYRAHGFFSPALARDTKFDEKDLELLWEALENMFELDRSAARGEMAMRKLVIFRHSSQLGNAPAHRLFDLVRVKRKDSRPAREFTDYSVDIDPLPPTLEGKVEVDVRG